MGEEARCPGLLPQGPAPAPPVECRPPGWAKPDGLQSCRSNPGPRSPAPDCPFAASRPGPRAPRRPAGSVNDAWSHRAIRSLGAPRTRILTGPGARPAAAPSPTRGRPCRKLAGPSLPRPEGAVGATRPLRGSLRSTHRGACRVPRRPRPRLAPVPGPAPPRGSPSPGRRPEVCPQLGPPPPALQGGWAPSRLQAPSPAAGIRPQCPRCPPGGAPRPLLRAARAGSGGHSRSSPRRVRPGGSCCGGSEGKAPPAPASRPTRSRPGKAATAAPAPLAARALAPTLRASGAPRVPAPLGSLVPGPLAPPPPAPPPSPAS